MQSFKYLRSKISEGLQDRDYPHLDSEQVCDNIVVFIIVIVIVIVIFGRSRGRLGQGKGKGRVRGKRKGERELEGRREGGQEGQRKQDITDIVYLIPKVFRAWM